MSARFELTRDPRVRHILASRWLPWLLIAATLPFFALAILTGLFGTPAGNRNFGIVFVWVVWWAVLILLLVPFGGRLWCAICPIPAPGEWLQRRAILGPRPGGRLHSLGLKWPRRLRNIWLQNAAFLLVALFAALILTTPLASAFVLLLMVGVALATSALFERRTFCRYLCPVGGFIGLYAQVAPLEVRVKDRSVCATHTVKTCYTGSEAGYGCPWLLYPATLDKNTYCGLCTECLKTCPHDNIGLYLRPPGADLVTGKGHRLDEAYKGMIMLTCALAYSVVLMGPWAALKEAAFAIGTPGWFAYAFVFLAANLVIVPGLFFACAVMSEQISHTTVPLRRLFVDYAYALVPLGLGAWAAFSVSFVFINLSYAWPVLSDPFGWGWNLFGTAQWTWTPYADGLLPYVQWLMLCLGLVGAIGVSLKTARDHHGRQVAAMPIVAFCVLFTLGLVWLYV
ncbi:MAG: 4Fe-4S binding protein [Chloroflexi bacterium]|nr:4Fe-4S binding protein [Chloroflexota bacterium]